MKSNNDAAVAVTESNLLCYWNFDTVLAGAGFDSISRSADIAHGYTELVPGVGDKGLRFDGFTTFIERSKGKTPQLTGNLTLEAWVTLGSFPWNHCPIFDVAQSKEKGVFFGINDQGGAVVGARIGEQWVEAQTPSLGLKQWNHVAATVIAGEGVAIYLNGKLIAKQVASGDFIPAGDIGIFIGRTREPIVGTGGIRPYAHLAGDMYLDGALDEIKVYSGAKTAEAIASSFNAVKAPSPAPLPERKFPSGPKGKGRFGAYYTHLKYYDAWDRRWRVGDNPDVIVRFDEEAYRLVFWRGTNYIPCWATEDNIWYTNEFNETWGHGAIGCAEPMSDKQCSYTHVRIIESNDARVVVHWRYALVDVFGTRPRKDPVTKWTDWSDELYTIYPDGTGTRKITLHSTQPLDPHEFQETMIVLQPGQRPEDVIEPEALTMANMQGQEHTYTWVGGCPEEIDKPDRANIQRVNIKSDTKPFLVVSPNNCLKRDLTTSDRPVFPVYREEIRAPQLFPWWNHWPTSDFPSDGRYAQSSDRAAHSSLLSGMEWEDYEVTPNSRTRVMMHGLTRASASGLVPLAKSWLRAPGMRIESKGFQSQRYEILERCYVIEATEQAGSELTVTIDANKEHPVENVCLIVKAWGREVDLRIDGEAVARGANFRQGLRDKLESLDLVVWIKLSREVPVQIGLVAVNKDTPQSAPVSVAPAKAKSNTKS
jgi:hypothetical protein